MERSQEKRFGDLDQADMLRVNQLCDQAELRWQSGETVELDKLLATLPPSIHLAALEELLPLEIEYRLRAGQTPCLSEYQQRFPQIDKAWLAEFIEAEQADPGESLPSRLGGCRILGLLGRGGMGIVFRAVHEATERVVAVKALSPEVVQNPVVTRRFLREVRAAAVLTHPNIVTAFDADQQDGRFFLVMEYVDGPDLQTLVRQNGALSIPQAIDYVAQVADGLGFAHSRGVIHRDIKPANLLLAPSGQVKILDMGLARYEDRQDPQASDLTKSNMVIGTAAYMSPEQARDVRKADERSDIYSLGCTLFYLLTGRTPFEKPTVVETIIAHQTETMPRLQEQRPDVSDELESVFRNMVAADPSQRYASAAEVAQGLRSCLATQFAPTQVLMKADEATSADPELAFPVEAVAATAMRNNPSPNRRLILGGMVGMLGVSALGLRAWVSGSRERKRPKEEEAPGTPSPRSSRGLMFNGRSSYVGVADLQPEPGHTYTIEAWAQPWVTRVSNIVSWLGPDWMAIYLNSESRWGVARRVGARSVLVAAQQPSQLHSLVHVAGVFEGDRLRLFIAGQPMSVAAVDFPLPTTSGGLFVGGFPSNLLPADQSDRFFRGLIRNVRVSVGSRYREAFIPPRSLPVDSTTLLSLDLTTLPDMTARGVGGSFVRTRVVDATPSDEQS